MSSKLPEFPASPADKYRLPTDVKPSHYNLTFYTDLKSLQFGGFVTIELDILRDTSAIILNCSDDLDLKNASVHCASLEANQFQSAQIADKELGRVTLNISAALPAGSKAQLKIHYNAPLRGSMNGYYKSAWKNEGQTEYYALTHFQPIDARAAFPCFDEPALKATFAITMVSRSDTVNLSNMPATSEESYDPSSSPDADLASFVSTLAKDIQWKITKFQVTPPMSSYLVAFANGSFSYLEKKVVMPLSGRTIPLRVYATPDIIHQMEFSLDVTAKVLPLYETIFNIEYPLPKLDTLAANDFDMGAMENWGLITGRTSAFSVDPAKADISARKRVAQTQSHEVAHMWFGNITTMEWWDYLYLNEGFASLMGEAIVLGEVFPEWEVNAFFVAYHSNRALGLDAKRSSHPIEVACPDPNFINQIFDGLSYSKAACVLRMLSDYVGEERFLKGVSLYLKNHLYGTSVTNDLWDGIAAATGQDIRRLMDNWVTKIGFPLITVTETSSGIHVRQDRFLNSGAPDAEDNETIWNVPLGILTVDKNGQVHMDKAALLEDRERSFAIDTSMTFKLNSGSLGVYRVRYTPERLSKIAVEAAKEDSVFSLSDRIGLLYDVAELSKAGLTQLSSFLTLIDIWRNETNYLVWSGVLTKMGTVLRIFDHHANIDDGLRAFLRTLFAPLVQRLGFDFPAGESVDVVQLRKTAIAGALSGRDESVIQALRARFADFMKTGDDTGIPADIRASIFMAAARFGGREEFEALLKITENLANPGAKSAAIAAVGFIQDSDLIDELLSYILTKARDQDAVSFCYNGLASNPVTRQRLPAFFKDNYDAFSKRFATNSMLKYLVEACFGELSTQKDYDETEEFFKDKDTTRYSMALAQALETIRTRIVYIERSRDDLSDWLSKWEERSKL
ncbi:leucyl aminopeptidase [Mycena rosella]|uniref:Aminopeptidase n=1 Tax=Mycena rosella TaxID=1033263 RepID=A0AAD7G7N4_MYCRO|nr:leucyl aminopeptidase [Mycena rosella]